MVWTVLIVGALLVAAVIAIRPVYRGIKTKRALRFVNKGENLLADGKWEDAGRHLHLALGLAPNDPRVLRLAARYCTQHALPEGLDFWQMLLATDGATPEDHLEYIRLCHVLNRLDFAQVELTALLKTQPTDRRLRILWLEQVRRRNNRDHMIRTAGALVTDFPQDEEVQSLAGRTLYADTNETVRAEGRRLLWGMAVTEGPFRHESVLTLSRGKELSRGETELLAHLLAAEGTTPLTNRLLAIELHLPLNPDERPARLNEALGLVDRNSSVTDRATLAEWLLQLGEPTAALDVLPLDEITRESVLLQLRLQALAALNRWEEFGPIVDDPDSVVPRALRFSYQGVAEAKLTPGHRELAVLSFRNALAACDHVIRLLELVAQHAEVADIPEIAIEAHRQLMSVPHLAVNSAREIIRLAVPIDDLASLAVAGRRLLDFEPDNNFILNEITYVDLLLGKPPAQGKATAQRLVQRFPDILTYRLTLALAELRTQNAPAALDGIEGFPVDWEKAGARTRLIYAAALAANHRTDAARQMARTIDLTHLGRTEQALLEP